MKKTKIISIQRIKNSTNWNPIYEIKTTIWTFKTSPDASYTYNISWRLIWKDVKIKVSWKLKKITDLEII